MQRTSFARMDASCREMNMKAIVVHEYGGPEVLKFEEYPDPVPGPGEVLVRVAAAGVNPLDLKRRAGLTKDYYPIHFPGLIGVDMAGTVVKIGPGAEGFSVGDRVFAMADNTYAEFCVVNVAVLAKVPEGFDLIQAAALPLVTVTGNQLLSATGIKSGQMVLVVGAVGNVGRSAVFTAKQRGSVVIAGVLKRQMDEAKTVGADQLVATDDDSAIANLPPLDAVADTVGGKTAEKLIAKVKPGGVFASVLKAPQNAVKYPSVKVVFVFSKFDRKTLEFIAEAVRDGKLVISISRKLPLSEAAEAQAAAEKGGVGKILLVA
jgi:NADPH:quinone reductase-like Zn-dependent oxidoreductase